MEKLEFNSVIKTQLEKSSRWAKLLSFFGFFIVGASIIILVTMLASNPGPLEFVALIINIIMLMPCLYLYYFSKKIMISVSNQDIKELESSFENLANFFHFIGIVIIIFITLNLFEMIR